MWSWGVETSYGSWQYTPYVPLPLAPYPLSLSLHNSINIHTSNSNLLFCTQISLSLPLMAAMHSLSLSSAISNCHRQHCSHAGKFSFPRTVCFQSTNSSFTGLSLNTALPKLSNNRSQCSQISGTTTMMMAKPSLQFIQGTDELTIPDVRLTKSRDGTNGTATFCFDQPSVFDSSGELGDLTGFYMIDEEGVIQSVDVNAKFVNGKPAGIEAKYVMRTPREWDRFMRFMERYSDANGLQFIKK